MRVEARTLYTLNDLREQRPEAFERAHKRWVESVYQEPAPWADEVLDSMRAVVEACGGTLDRNGNPLADDFLDDGTTPKDAAWLRLNVLKPNGYTGKNGHPRFPGLCKWTGYCADDDMIEDVYDSMLRGMGLTDALRALENVAQKLNEQDLQQQADVDSMLDNWGEEEYDENGDEA